ncbi:3-mercaptopyruvate sulfurtransferase (MST) [Leptomonas pyrrhocoris]|uniref:3-mercaptopyruvate sulfurtransferase (MST) n=1 Tax=Leptomonas pyrrhocoris TaxID=157538 RepID=A0A0N0DQM8_LEPPY|nr:3-mercaptopyruvate sulfurtransferase (MST) [Leptomonas pyrrhocoris]XP_015651850.1 3-mercaptopyruvate sulfurtransferase (MST) [Leptomonas pyrrhocoris]XP_015651851.1 3-mercaptopyruvate sulfurtransferase (MST) [Leptomonas pyrrhocoris]KPA73410.1 3-mercaptopyruvate sulfurtransferase (MST) [Leptomonas pyrrhocoris]KPA73411.1 3-mercaptopyruvate sulfurtransferase (MST) [Leptomonas pyrrhocoris]KPA73412.1 3-mercaptopyruvate sulfurtransferase (MST) [Leptomonas pyrrhocoris]|eukprot:XP_015651849.1 3-mercaptopyruvate sulfurtransferase (MST) [Leptomonas pyrrhocoris]
MPVAAKHPGKVFVKASAVKDYLGDYRIFDCRYNLAVKDHGTVEFAKAHVQGATRVDVDEDLSAITKSSTARHPLPPCEKFISWCKANGISDKKPVLCYDDECGAMGACRLWWMLDALGVETYVVDGGAQACKAAGIAMESGEPPAPPPPTSEWPFRTAYAHHYVVGEIPPNAVITDARVPQRFNSTVRPYAADPLPGHIEGAVNLPYNMHLVQPDGYPVLREESELRENILDALRGSIGSDTAGLSKCVFSCGSGLSACINIALVQQLGLGHPYLYCGSWSEYCGLFRFPMLRSIVNDYGMYIQLHTPSLGDNPKADAAVHTIEVDGTPSKSLDAELTSALAHLHAGEKGTVYFKSGRVATIEVIKTA